MGTPATSITQQSTTEADTFFAAWLASEEAARDSLMVKRIYIDINDGNLYDGVLFSQIMYWHGTNRETGKPRLKVFKNGHLWLVKGYKDWWAECRVKANTAKRCISRMVKRGLLIREHHRYGGMRTVHLRVNPDKFEELVRARLDTTYPTGETLCTIAASRSDTTYPTLNRDYTETTDREYSFSAAGAADDPSPTYATDYQPTLSPFPKEPGSAKHQPKPIASGRDSHARNVQDAPEPPPSSARPPSEAHEKSTPEPASIVVETLPYTEPMMAEMARVFYNDIGVWKASDRRSQARQNMMDHALRRIVEIAPGDELRGYPRSCCLLR